MLHPACHQTLRTVLSVMRELPAFSTLSEADKGLLLLLARPVDYAPGVAIFTEGDRRTNEVFLLITGEFSVMSLGAHEVEDTRGTPEILGEMAATGLTAIRTRTIRAHTGVAGLVWDVAVLAASHAPLAARFREALERWAFQRAAQALPF